MIVLAINYRTNTFYHQELRKKYEAAFVCEWTPSREHCRVLYNSSLRELDSVPDPWHPTENMEAAIKTHSKICSPKKTLSNALAVHDCKLGVHFNAIIYN